MLKKIFVTIWHIPRNFGIVLIRVYQFLLSPDHSFWAKWVYPDGYCKFYPSCSNYTVESLQKRGLIVGILKGSWRILRCNPWSKGGIDNP